MLGNEYVNNNINIINNNNNDNNKTYTKHFILTILSNFAKMKHSVTRFKNAHALIF